MRALIFAAGAFNPNKNARIIRQEGDIVIAANGGTLNCLSLGIRPDFIVGDLDSIKPDDLKSLEFSGTKIVEFPIRKNFTDLELALQHACVLNATEILIYGGLGLRWDQTLANILLLASPDVSCSNIKLLDGKQEIYLVSKAAPVHVFGNPGDIVSLIPVSGDVVGITTKNLEYALNDEILFFGASRGVSNVMTTQSASISLKDGSLICILIRQ